MSGSDSNPHDRVCTQFFFSYRLCIGKDAFHLTFGQGSWKRSIEIFLNHGAVLSKSKNRNNVTACPYYHHPLLLLCGSEMTEE